jgi:uncharacterized membrane protein (UPF0182 family)
MTRGQKMAAIIAGIAAFLLLGRGAAIAFVDIRWFDALHADAVWRAQVYNTLLLYGGALLVGIAFAFANILAVRRSVIALIVPKRVGNVEIGEEVPSSRLIIVAAGMSVVAAGTSLFALPSWTTLALWRAGVTFNETDPYFGLDLSHYVAWLPLEIGVYVWLTVLFAIVALLVVTLYALTPSLRWGRSGLHVTTYARRHLTVLATILILFTAWGFRIDAFNTLVTGSGAHGVFTHVDHRWIVPANLALSVATIGAAVVLLATGWMGQTPAAFVTITIVIVCAIATKIVLPWVARVSADNPENATVEAPYGVTQRAFTARAFPNEKPPPSARFAANATVLSIAPKLQRKDGLRAVVYPDARGVAVESNWPATLPTPRVGGVFSRLAYAWATQTPRFLQRSVSDSDAVIRTRDVRDRVRAVAPIFVQSDHIGARPSPDGILWIVDLYAQSDKYPLSTNKHFNGVLASYRRHAATAYVNGMTGAVTIVRDHSTPDPIADAWFSAYGDDYLATSPPPTIDAPWPTASGATPGMTPGMTPSTVTADSAFRMKMLDIYVHMRTALDSGDFKKFGDAFDSLGAAVGVRP